ncbi:MAG: preprotein translocase subunit YajC [Lachnospiraceae bacterium]|nr:preprotein translocase subunit YajC [Lachnospiraceae bacterium]
MMGGSNIMMLVWIGVLVVFFYATVIRPQNKEQKEKGAMMAALAVGDTILTTSGFYGVVIDIEDDTVIVEFGSNRNCRIPMQKAAIAAVEKPESVQKGADDGSGKDVTSEEEKKGGLLGKLKK